MTLSNDAEKWYRIWDIVFRSVSHPASPYYDSGMRVPLGMIENYMATALPVVICRNLTFRIGISQSVLDTIVP